MLKVSFFVLLFLEQLFVGKSEKLLQNNSYSLNLTKEQYRVMFKPYILQYQNKKCNNLPNTDPHSCYQYCRTFYRYVPLLQFKNAQAYNYRTGQCQPKPICPNILGVRFDDKKSICYDSFTNTQIQPIDAEDPHYAPSELLEVTFLCKYGKVIRFNGIFDCKCDLGYTSYLDISWGQKLVVEKCQTPVPFILYLPDYLKVYYDESYDNMFPLPQNPRFWSQSLFYYLRKVKYRIITFFTPYEVEIVLMTIPQEEDDKSYVYGIILSILGIFLISSMIFCASICQKQEKEDAQNENEEVVIRQEIIKQ